MVTKIKYLEFKNKKLLNVQKIDKKKSNKDKNLNLLDKKYNIL